MKKKYMFILMVILFTSSLIYPVCTQSNYAGEAYDVDKYYFATDFYPTYRDPDDTSDILMCWAAAASNILAYSGYARTPVPEEEGVDIPLHYQVYHDLLSMAPNHGASVKYGINLYLGRFYPDIEPNQCAQDGAIGWSSFEEWLLEGRPVGLEVNFWNEEGLPLSNGHAITCWSYNLVSDGDDYYEEGDIYDLFVSDSDDYRVYGNPTPATLEQLYLNKNVKKMRISLIDDIYWVRKIVDDDYRYFNAPASSVWTTTSLEPLEEDVLPYFYELEDQVIPRADITLTIKDDDGEQLEYSGKKYYFDEPIQTGYLLQPASITKTDTGFLLDGVTMSDFIEKSYKGELTSTKIIQGDLLYLYYGVDEAYQLHYEPGLTRVYRSTISAAYDVNYFSDLDKFLIENPDHELIDSNIQPFAHIKPVQDVYEGKTVLFDASESYDVFDDPLEYRWDLDGDGVWDTDWSSSPVISHTWGDDYSGTVKVCVSDLTHQDTAEITVTVSNVAPTVETPTCIHSNPYFILPGVHLIQFTAAFNDPGWLDTHTAVWDWGDGSAMDAVLTEENDEPDSTGTCTGSHTYMAPGAYTVTLTVTDDDGGSGYASMEITVVTVVEAVHETDMYIQGLPDSVFRGKADLYKKALGNMFSAVKDKLAQAEYLGAMKQLMSIRDKADGVEPDWITDPMAQEQICIHIDDINCYLKTLI